MLSAFRSALTTPDLRKKILFTRAMVAVYRAGAAIPAPGVSYPNVQECIRQVEGGQMPLHMRLPKLKGFKNRFRVEYQVVNIGDLARLFPDGGTVGPDELASAGAVRPKKLVKVLGDGDLRGITLTVSAHAFSGSARDKITGAGGSVTEL